MKNKKTYYLYFGCSMVGLLFGTFLVNGIMTITGFQNNIFFLFWTLVYSYLIAIKMYNHLTKEYKQEGL